MRTTLTEVQQCVQGWLSHAAQAGRHRLRADLTSGSKHTVHVHGKTESLLSADLAVYSACMHCASQMSHNVHGGSKATFTSRPTEWPVVQDLELTAHFKATFTHAHTPAPRPPPAKATRRSTQLATASLYATQSRIMAFCMRVRAFYSKPSRPILA